ncbi:aspartate/glutamate racemase family protein [Chloroflexota bacterium]
MRLVLIPPYQNPLVNWGWVLREHVANFKQKGQLEGVEVDVDDGYFIDNATQFRDEEVIALVTVGILKKVREYGKTGKYDAIVLSGGCDPGFVAARAFSEIPVTAGLHSALHVASLIGERVSMLHGRPEAGLLERHLAERYGLSHKLVSVRAYIHSSTYMYSLISKYQGNKKERSKDPELKKIIDDITAQGIMAIEKDRADSLILSSEANQLLEEEIRQSLDKAGYDEIPIICPIPAALEMAKAMVNMKLVKAPRAFPSGHLKTPPEYY